MVGTRDDPYPVMPVLELWGIPRQEHAIIDSLSELLEPLLIIHIHQSRHVLTGVVGVYGFALPLHTVEQGKQQDLIGNNTLPVDVVHPHSPKHMEQLIQGIQQHPGMRPFSFLVIGDEGLILQGGCIEVWDIL